jgi:hypothetical protein
MTEILLQAFYTILAYLYWGYQNNHFDSKNWAFRKLLPYFEDVYLRWSYTSYNSSSSLCPYTSKWKVDPNMLFFLLSSRCLSDFPLYSPFHSAYPHHYLFHTINQIINGCLSIVFILVIELQQLLLWTGAIWKGLFQIIA